MEEIKQEIENKKNRSGKTSTVFLYAGWLSETKGIIDLLEAFLLLKYQNIELRICGDGEQRDSVKEYSAKDCRIKYLGKLGSKDLKKQYQEGDVLIIPSRWDEPFGRVVIEGNAHGLPVIGSNKGGIPEIIHTLNSGMLFESGNIRQLADAISYLSSRENYLPFWNGIMQGIHQYTIQNQIKEFEVLYRQCLSLKNSQ